MHWNSEQLASLAATREVRVAEVPFALLLCAHHAAQTTGLLHARRGPVDKRVVLEHGVPVDCRSNLLHETLARYLVGLGRLDEKAANAALAESAWRGALLGEILVQQGRLDSEELTRVLQQNLAKKLLDLFTWPDGEVVLEPAQGPSGSALKLKVPQLVLTGVTRFMPQAAIDRAIAPVAGELLVRHPEAAALAEELKLAARDSQVLAALGRPRRIEELVAEVRLGAGDVARELYALVLVGLVLPASRAAAATAPRLPARTPATAASSPAPVAAAAPAAAPSPPAAESLEAGRRAELLNRVSEIFLVHRQKDPLDLLGVAEDADPAVIESRFLAFAREFAPWRFEEPGLRLGADYARELFLAGVAAYAQLADPERRIELIARRRRQREEAERGQRSAQHRIDTDLLDPALQFRKGMALKQAGKLGPALQQLEFAADCDPQNGTYRAETAHCRWLLAPNTVAERVLEELLDAQRVDPKAVEAFLYFGQIATAAGRYEEAEVGLRRAAKLLGPQDRRALDALHDLAKARKKKR